MLKHFCCSTMVLVHLAVTAALADETKSTTLPLGRVVLFSSGVGFFEHSGRVTDDAKVAMKFKTSDINDLLKSMVAEDLDGGNVSTIMYGSKDPISKTLKSFSIDLTGKPTLAQLLDQLRGEEVLLEASTELRGVILGVETKKTKHGEHDITETEYLNLVTEDGLRTVPLDGVNRVKLTNTRLDAELRKALAVLASSHATDKKSVDLTFTGKGNRRVRVGYIQSTPVWKTTYRLVLTDDKPLLQGWAIVENTSEEDWSGVKLTLISGRPISFTMDLYQPLYIPRPRAELELYSSIPSLAYGQNLLQNEFARPAPNKPTLALPMEAATVSRGNQTLGRKMNSSAGGAERALSFGVDREEDKSWFELRSSVQSAAQSSNVGNLFQYVIDAPVTLPRQQSAMLPIVNADVTGEKVSIYDSQVLAKHPLYGLKFTNQTDLYLMQGPITVFDGGVYAGDARIEDMAPGAKRLISYGIDLDTEVVPQTKDKPDELLSVKLIKGTLIASRKYQRSTEYTVKNSSKKAKKVLVEYPIDKKWTLISPKQPTEKTRELYRFAVEAGPRATAKLDVAEERTEQQHLAITNLDDNTIHYYVRSNAVNDKVKAALSDVVKRKQQLQQVAVHKQQLEQRIRTIEEDQSRIRQNMNQLDRNTDIYRTYVKKFSDQETEIEKIRAEIVDLNASETELRKALDDYLVGLDVG